MSSVAQIFGEQNEQRSANLWRTKSAAKREYSASEISVELSRDVSVKVKPQNERRVEL
jgi:hypothetical protein